MINRTLLIGCTCLLTMLMVVVPLARAEVNEYACGPLRNGYGPFDYRSDKDKLQIVEGAHFTPQVANLISGNTGPIGADIDYTLRASPNHHRALMAMVRLGEKEKRNRPQGAKYSVECYLNRGLRFRPDDATVKMIYATFLAKKGRQSEALTQLNEAETIAGENANLFYNMGLAYFELKDFDKALIYAHKAYQMNFPLPGLRNKLMQLGKWSEPDPESTR